MPYCTKCGTNVSNTDKFCASCGTEQRGSPGPGASTPGGGPSGRDVSSGTSDRTMRILCYVPWVGWLAAIFVLASDRYKIRTQQNNETRFHAFQGLYLFVAWLVVHWVAGPMMRMAGYGFFMPGMGGVASILHLLILVAWIVMLVKTSKNQHFALPILGEWAERSVNEQRGM